MLREHWEGASPVQIGQKTASQTEEQGDGRGALRTLEVAESKSAQGLAKAGMVKRVAQAEF